MILQHWIEYPSEPKALLLVWQAPMFVADRLRWAVGRLTNAEDGPVFNYLEGDEFAALNLGRSVSDLRGAGFVGYPAFDTGNYDGRGFRDHVLEAFLRRVPMAARADFGDYLAHFHVPRTTKLSPFALLAITEARLPSDDFSLIDPLDPSASCVDHIFEIAGFRHLSGNRGLVQLDEQLELEAEPWNAKDPYAVRVKACGDVIGYVNRLQAATVGTWLRERTITCWIARVAGKPEMPHAYAFLRVRPMRQSIAA